MTTREIARRAYRAEFWTRVREAVAAIVLSGATLALAFYATGCERVALRCYVTEHGERG